jgi:hypothetical protein
MKKVFRFFTIPLIFFAVMNVLPVSGQAPPPPSHSRNGNQTSPGGGTGCPLDRTQGILIAVALSLAYGGFALYMRGRKEKEQK